MRTDDRRTLKPRSQVGTKQVLVDRATLLAALKYALLAVGALTMIAPFVDMIFGALRTPAERLAVPQVYWPSDPQWSNFTRVFVELPMVKWLTNSVLITVVITALQLATSAMAGYALAKYRFWGSNSLLRTVLGAQMFPFFLLMIPIFFLLRYVPLVGGNDFFGSGGNGLLNTYMAAILPFSISWYGIFLMRQFSMNVPDDIIDAARIDGAGEFRIFFTIVLPQLRASLATLATFVFIYHWNEVIWTMTVTRSAPDLRTIPVGIYLLRGAFVDPSAESLQRAAVCISIIPIMIVFLALQRFYVRGLTAGSVKG